MVHKVRRVSTIHSRVRIILDKDHPEDVKYNHSLSHYVGGGASAIDAFLVTVNDYPSFKSDGLQLIPANIPNSPKVHDLTSAVAVDYERRGWRLTL